VKGEPILASKLSSVGGGLALRIPESMRASSVNVNEVSGVSGFILPGDRVDIIATIDRVGDSRNSVAKTILQDVEVLASGVKTESKNDKPMSVQCVTLLVNPKGAEELALALHEGKLHLVLRNPVDRTIANVRRQRRRISAARARPLARTVPHAAGQPPSRRPFRLRR
jgi:pilus assembly protein CpaB